MARSQGMRNLRTAGTKATNYTLNTASKASNGLWQWATTDHSGLSEALDRMPSMGFIDTIKYTLWHFLISMIGAVLGGIWIFILIAYGIPALLRFFLSHL